MSLRNFFLSLEGGLAWLVYCHRAVGKSNTENITIEAVVVNSLQEGTVIWWKDRP